jgi:hypothetical protein
MNEDLNFEYSSGGTVWPVPGTPRPGSYSGLEKNPTSIFLRSATRRTYAAIQPHCGELDLGRAAGMARATARELKHIENR